jgi:methionyl-tRNA formyltransferase
MKNLRIVFMGTPEFAVATLGALLMNSFNVVAVVTAPDKPAGRGRKITKSAVKRYSELNCLSVFQPQNLRDPEFIQHLTDLRADIFVVVAFRMLPEAVWKIPALGTINLHASLLPHYRGAAPINHAIINGETKTGITTFLIDDKIDTGNILLREVVQVYPDENAGELHDRLMKHGARLVIRTIEGLAAGDIKPMPQEILLAPGEKARIAPKITPDFCNVDWNNEPVAISNFIRGLSPVPCARGCFISGEESLSFKIFEGQPEKKAHDLNPGSIVSDGKTFIRIACRNGFISISSLQLEGKKRMETPEFLRGFNIERYAHIKV